MRLLTAIIITLTCLAAADPPAKTLAVLDFKAPSMDPDLVMGITERVRTELIRTGKYIVINREEVRKRLGKDTFRLLRQCSNIPCVVEQGQKLMTDYIVTGNIRRFGPTLVVVLRLVDMAKKNVGNIITKRYDGKPIGINPTIADASRQLVGAPLVLTPKPAESSEAMELPGEPEPEPVKQYDPVRYAVGLLRYADGVLAVFDDYYSFESKKDEYEIPFKAVSHMEYISLFDDKQQLQEALLVVHAEYESKKKKFTYVDFGLPQAKEFSRQVGCNLYVKNRVYYGGEIR